MATTHNHKELEQVVNEALKKGDLSILQAYNDRPYDRSASKATPEDIVKVMADWANSYSVGKKDYEELVAHFTNEHRTNQQSMMKAIIALILGIADLDDCRFDGRNERMRDFCRFVRDAIKRHGEEHPNEPNPAYMPLV